MMKSNSSRFFRRMNQDNDTENNIICDKINQKRDLDKGKNRKQCLYHTNLVKTSLLTNLIVV